MKKSILKLVLLLLAVPVMFIGCKKTEVIDESTTNASILKEVPVYCGTQVVKNLYAYGSDATVYGNVTVGNDATNLYVTVNLAGDWLFWNEGFPDYAQGLHLFVGTQQQLLNTNAATLLGPVALDWITLVEGEGYFAMYDFPYHADGSQLGINTYMFTVPRSSILDDQGAVLDCDIMLVLGASIKNAAGDLKLVSAKQTLKHPAYWFTYCMQTCITHHETAYAFGGDPNDCFLVLPGVNSTNWGWSNGPVGPGTYDWPIYAGAGQCNINNGTLVGNLHVVYASGVATVEYQLNPGFNLDVTHLWVGNDILPKVKGKYTTAPGQFPYTGNPITVTGLSGNIRIAAHSVVSW